HADAGALELLVSRLVLVLSTPARRIEHYPYVDPRLCAAITEPSSEGSENTNLLMRGDFFADRTAPRMGSAVSSGRTISERDIGIREQPAAVRAHESGHEAELSTGGVVAR